MKRLTLLFFGIISAIATRADILHVPTDYPTIQQGIDAANTGDTVLVHPGIYMENINFFGKEITVASRFLTTQDTSFVSKTVIRGNQEATSVVTFYNNESPRALLCGFTITNGNAYSGGGISCYSSNPTLKQLTIKENVAGKDGYGYGGGMYLDYAMPVVEDVVITGNTANRGNGGGIYISNWGDYAPILKNVTISNNRAIGDGWNGGEGGGICCYGYGYPVMSGVTIVGNSAGRGGGICCYYGTPVFDTVNRCNIYLNLSEDGSDLYSDTYMEVIVDTFTVMYPTAMHAVPRANFSFDILHCKLEQVDADLYVSPQGDDTNRGLSADDPLKSITYALSIIVPDSASRNTVHLLEGTYSPSLNGEHFPLKLPDFISLTGTSQHEVVLDAEGSSEVIRIKGNTYNKLSKMSITGGLDYGINCESSGLVIEQASIYGNTGPGMACNTSIPRLTNVTIKNNRGTSAGGGIFLYNCQAFIQNTSVLNNSGSDGGGIYCGDNSRLSVQSVIISNNSAKGDGGGIYYAYDSQSFLENVTIKNNSADVGGGMYIAPNASLEFDSLNRCNIYLNTAQMGNDMYVHYQMYDVIVDTFSVEYPTDFHAYPVSYYHFDILHGRIQQVEADLYVSPDGDDGNSGLTADEPLRTIRLACLKILADSLHLHTIHLKEGKYSPSATGESFPVIMRDYVSLSGTEQHQVILIAEGSSGVMIINRCEQINISGLTITGGNDEGGIQCFYSDPHLLNVTISGNSTNGGGGGLYCIGSSPHLQNVTISNNSAQGNGGGIYSEGNYRNDSGIYLQNVTISNNSAVGGGGICSANSSLTFDSVNGCNIYLNKAPIGSDLISTSPVVVIVDTFTVMFPNSWHASPLENYSFDIRFGLIPQLDVDLFVSPDGDDGNTGLTEDEPLKTIHHAYTIAHQDSQNFYTINLSNGTYSSSSTGEVFPVLMADYLHLSGESEKGVILDAGGQSCVLDMNESQYTMISNLTITGGGNHYYGGGICCIHSDPVIQQVTITDNGSGYGEGGGIYCYNSYPVIQQVTITGNTASCGGGIFLSHESQATMQNVTISDNHASGYYWGEPYGGGGICCDSSSLSTQQVTISDNSAERNGGGIYCSHSYLVMYHATISGNNSLMGGGLALSENLKTELNNVDISYNNAENEGGGVHSSQSGFLIENSIVSRNRATTNGGGISLNYQSNALLKNVQISGNLSDGSGGGIYCEYKCNPILQNVTMADNEALTAGGIYCRASSNPVLTNSILWNDLPQEMYFHPTGSDNSVSLSYSCVEGGEEGIVTNGNGTVQWLEGSMADDPLFADNGVFPYALAEGSSCIDAGKPDTTGLNLPPWDILGNLRIWDGDGNGVAVVDMGAYEYGSLPVFINPMLNAQCSTLNVQCYPNPFSDHITFEYILQKSGVVSLTILDYVGQQVAVPLNEAQSNGAHYLKWNADGLPAGVYFYKLTVNGERKTVNGKVVLVR